MAATASEVMRLQATEALAEGDWGQEGGADFAAKMLSRYDPETRDWRLPREGPFWDAVASAHELGRFGHGQTIAIIDDGFDASIPALAEQRLAWTIEGSGPANHGTVVALIVLDVAPRASLLLYPTAVNGKWSEELVERALRHVPSTTASIVNLSLGQAFPTALVFEAAASEFLLAAEPWPNMSAEDLPFWTYECFSRLNSWRELIRAPITPVGQAARATAEGGCALIAAAGNARGYVFSPALEADAYSIAFIREQRSIVDGLEEEAVAITPTYSQSEFSDFAVIQPPGVLGSSFATPLISGLAAVMSDTNDLEAYREVTRAAGLAGELYVKLDDSTQVWSERREGVVDKLFMKAVNSAPHAHLNPANYEVCPECSFFCSAAFINFGLLKLTWGDVDGAEQLLRPAEAFAPFNPHAAANLGMVYATRAQKAQERAQWSNVSVLLSEAARLLQKASDLRPAHEPYRRRVAEFSAGADDPRHWRLAP